MAAADRRQAERPAGEGGDASRPFAWHYRAAEDELVVVIRERFRVEFRDRSVWLEEGELLVVPRGVEHRPVTDGEADMLLFKPATTVTTVHVGNERTVDARAWL